MVCFALHSPQAADEVQRAQHVSHRGRSQRGSLPLQAAGPLPERPRRRHAGGQLGGRGLLPAGRGQRQGASRRPADPQLRPGSQPLAVRRRVLARRHRLLLLRAAERLGPLGPGQRPALDQVLREPGPLRPRQAARAVTGVVSDLGGGREGWRHWNSENVTAMSEKRILMISSP